MKNEEIKFERKDNIVAVTIVLSFNQFCMPETKSNDVSLVSALELKGMLTVFTLTRIQRKVR